MSTGIVNTPVTGVTTLTAPVAVANYEDYRVLSNKPQEAIISHMGLPSDRPMTKKLAVQKISNMYTGTDISEAYQLPSKSGKSILAQTMMTLEKTDTDGKKYHCPISVHTVIKSSDSPLVTDEDLLEVVAENNANLYEQGVVDASRITAYRHGVVLPKAL
jgi:hypothetical protein